MPNVQDTVSKAGRPVKILQYGEGNFLRAFVDAFVDEANEKGVFDGSVAIVKPIPHGSLEGLTSQDCVYTVLLRGREGGETVEKARRVTCVDSAVDSYADYDAYLKLAALPELRFVVSNTTEAGIVYDETDEMTLTPPRSYPGKLVQFLHERWKVFGGASDKGLILLPVELIENNGGKLLDCCQKLAGRWGLPDDFQRWLREDNLFCQTLVDRIVTGYPRDDADKLQEKWGYTDGQITVGEPFALWVIESPRWAEVQRALPLDAAGLPVVFTDNLKPYRERKVRLLNGAHTSTVLAAYLAGLDTVGDMMADTGLRQLLEHNVYKELAPCVPLPADEVRAFADAVLERFENPFLRHSLLAISLNSVSKWKSRVLPTVRDTIDKTGAAPDGLSFSLAALIAFYSGQRDENGRLAGCRGDAPGDTYEILDDAPVLDFFAAHAGLSADQLTAALLARADFWGEDLTALPGLEDKVAGHLQAIRDHGVRAALAALLR